MAEQHLSDKELLLQFKEPSTKEKGYTRIIKKYQEKLYWHIRRMVVSHDDTDDVPSQSSKDTRHKCYTSKQFTVCCKVDPEC